MTEPTLTTTSAVPTTIDRRPLRPHHGIALVTSAGLSAIALFDAATHGLTGQSSIFSDDSGRPGIATLGGIVHGIAYVALGYVLVVERALFAGRLARALRVVLLVAFALFAVLFLIASPINYLATGRAAVPEGSPAGVVIGVGATAAFVGMLLGGLVLGLTQLRRPTLGVGGRILIAMGPALLLIVLLAVSAPDWSHPGYLEVVLNLGVSLIGVGLVAGRRVD